MPRPTSDPSALRVAQPFLGLLVLFAVWAFLSITFPLSKLLLPDVFTVLQALSQLVVSGELTSHLYKTLLRVLSGVLLSLLLGLPLGVSLASSERFGRPLIAIVDFFRSIPIAMLFPAFIILFGIGEMARMLMVLYLGLPIMIVSVFVGATERPETRGRRQYLAVHRSLIPNSTRWLAIVWDALPAVISGVKFTLSVGIVVVVVSEMFFVASAGLGWAAYQAYNSFDIPVMYAYVLVAGLIGYLANIGFDGLLQFIERQG